jgi:GNAT superfamily N-acetyltransferase
VASTSVSSRPAAVSAQADDAELDDHHLTGVEHQHLAILAVRPDRQGQGIGTALLDAYHAVLDDKSTVAYLEASDERTRRIYLHHNYVDYGTPIQLADGPHMFPMVRRPTPQHP